MSTNTDSLAVVSPSPTSLEGLVERMEDSYKRLEYMRGAWESLGISQGRSQAFRVVAEMSEATAKTLQNLTRLETLYEVMCRLQEHKEP